MSLKINVPFSVVNILLLALTSMTFAQTQSPQTTSPEGKREGIQHKVQLQFLVTSNKVNDRSEFPSALEPVVKQLKLSSGFKSHWLVATYIYSVAEGASLEVSDVTYAPFESGGGLVPKFFSFAVSDIKSNPALETLYISRLKFHRKDTRRRHKINQVSVRYRNQRYINRSNGTRGSRNPSGNNHECFVRWSPRANSNGVLISSGRYLIPSA